MGIGLAFFLPACAALAQYAGPAPTKADGPNPNNKGLLESAPSELLPGLPILLHPGDLIQISVYGVPDYKANIRIAGNGVADLPLVGGMHLAGLTVEHAQKSVEQKLMAGNFILNPDVLITVQSSNVDVIGVVGQVNHPEVIPAYASMNLLDALAAAGGLKPDASHSISILRKGVSKPLLVVLNSDPAKALEQNIPLYPGDRVVVPQIGVVYVVGAVKQQGAFPLSPNTPMTLLQAVALSGGTGFQASEGDTRIIRTEGTERREIKVDLGKVAKGEAKDPILQNDDIVMIPTSHIKAAIKGGGIGIAVGLLYLLPRP
jgi:polysaccharide export outer membrane protein